MPNSTTRVFARSERFFRAGGDHFRRNEIWRTVIDRRTGTPLREELVRANVALVKYVPVGVEVIDVSTGTDITARQTGRATSS